MIMATEKSAGAIVFRKKDNLIYYLLLRYPTKQGKKEYWGFAKGGIEKGEKVEETVKREVEEETGLKDISFINGFREKEEYIFTKKGKKVFKTVIFLLAETKTEKVKISWEHFDFKWLPYNKALEKLTFDNAKEILRKAHRFIE